MSQDIKPVRRHLCPACFAKEMDPAVMNFDEDASEYYCIYCCYSGSDEEIKAFAKAYSQHKYGARFLFRGEPSQ